TASRIHQHIEKNSVWLKEVLTRQSRHANAACIFGAPTLVRSDANSARKACIAHCRDDRSAHAAAVFVIHTFNAQRCRSISATGSLHSTARGADSESRILAIKKFSRAMPPPRIGARQTRAFARIAQHRFAAHGASG